MWEVKGFQRLRRKQTKECPHWFGLLRKTTLAAAAAEPRQHRECTRCTTVQLLHSTTSSCFLACILGLFWGFLQSTPDGISCQRRFKCAISNVKINFFGFDLLYFYDFCIFEPFFYFSSSLKLFMWKPNLLKSPVEPKTRRWTDWWTVNPNCWH